MTTRTPADRPQTLDGVVTGTRGRFTVVECADVAQLRAADRALGLTESIHYLLPADLCGARTGDRVRLAYQTTPTSGRWRVVEVLS